MEITELQSKSSGELRDLLQHSKGELGKLRRDVYMKQLKNIRQIRDVRKTIARILTILNSNVSK